MNSDKYGKLADKLRSMSEGNRHNTVRDVVLEANGWMECGALTAGDYASLRSLCTAVCAARGWTEAQAEREWDEAEKTGRGKPLDCARRYAADGDGQLDWDDPIVESQLRALPSAPAEPAEPDRAPPEDADRNSWGCRQAAEWLGLLGFKPDETVVFCLSFQRAIPVRVSEALRYLAAGDFDGAFSTPDPEFGMLADMNPTDGRGAKAENVTAFRNALVECDGIPVADQLAWYRRLRLPIRCVTHSGNRSAHAVVAVDAADARQYAERVRFLYSVCRKAGLAVDEQCGNPNRHTRLPGVTRGGSPQYIISGACGAASWDEWRAWVEDRVDGLPPFTALDLSAARPPLAEELIEGLLRVGHKMRLVGPSKAGKSFALMELALAIASGGEWLGRVCRMGRALYVNMELDGNSCINRFFDIAGRMGVCAGDLGDRLSVWNLRGCAMDLEGLEPRLTRRVRASGGLFDAIIFDPVYKLLTGDENSAGDMARFCGFFDKIAKDNRCAVIDCHHHSKGAQSGKTSIDRASGSGVFARDPDAILDFLQLSVPEDAAAAFRRQLERAAMDAAAGPWAGRVEESDKVDTLGYMRLLEVLMGDADPAGLSAVRAARAAAGGRAASATGWKVSFTLREFASPKPLRVWFAWPVHEPDPDGLLDGTAAADEDGARKTRKTRKVRTLPEAAAARREPKELAFAAAFLDLDPTWRRKTRAELAEESGLSEVSVKTYLLKLAKIPEYAGRYELTGAGAARRRGEA